MKRNMIKIVLLALGLFSANGATLAAETNAASDSSADGLAPLRDPKFLFEISRHLYRWYLDEKDVDNIPPSGPAQVWIRRLEPKLDPGDESIFAQVIVPGLGLSVTLKDTDYWIEELGVRVNSDTFKITHVERIEPPPATPAGYEALTVDRKDLLEYLRRTRDQRDYPDKELSRRMADALIEQYDDFPEAMKEPQQIVFWSPLSPVANEIWAFWETAGKLIHFSSDIDLANPAVWEQDELSTEVYDVDSQVLVSHNEAPGSNRFITRDQIGRALYNCVVLGQKRTTPTQPLIKEIRKLRRLPGRRGP